MFRLTLRTIAAHRRRLLSTVVSIVLGVAFLVGTFVFNDSLQRTFDDLFASVYAETDVVVRSTEQIDIGQGVVQRGRIPDDVVEAVAAVPGVEAAEGFVTGYARILSPGGRALGSDQGSPNFGMQISDDPQSVWTMRAGRVPTGPAEMAMDALAFDEGGFALGDRVTVLSQAGTREFILVGVVGFGSADSPVGSRVALFDLETAQEFVGRPGEVDAVFARGDGSVGQAELAEQVRAAMPAGTETLTGGDMAADQANEIQDAMGFFTTLLVVFALIALFVGSFIIYNTFSIIVAQRRRENALLRAIGASRRQVEGALLLEAAIMGVVGSLMGLGAGFGMAVLLRRLLDLVGIELPGGDLVVQPSTIVVSLSVGIIITIASAVLPARRGAHVPPIAALRNEALEQPAFAPRRLAAGILLLAGAVTLVVVGLGGELVVLGVGVAAVFVGMFVIGPLIARPVSFLIGAPLVRLRGLSGAMARENSMRNPKRTARTAAALMVGVALVVTITVFASSAKASIRAMIGEQFVGDFVVSTNTFGFGGLPTTLAPELDRIEGVEAATGVQIGLARVEGQDQGVSVIDPPTVGRVFDLGITTGSIEDLDDDGVLISQEEADQEGLRIGDTVTMTFLDGSTHTTTVQGVYERDELAGAYTIAKSLYAQSGGDQYDFAIYLVLADGASASSVEDELLAAIAPYPTADVESREGYIDSQAAQIDTFVNLVYGLLALAVVIAVVGIANTLSLSVHERTRELGLLRAVGATRAQVRSMIRWESVITALLGAVQGIVLGVLLGWAVIVALRSEGFTTFDVPISGLLIVLVVAVLCGVVAAARPARRAARLDILEAIGAG